jgi:hypothetical protein
MQPVYFHPSGIKKEAQHQRKEIDRDAVRKVLLSALEGQPAATTPARKVLEPGQTISFDSI